MQEMDCRLGLSHHQATIASSNSAASSSGACRTGRQISHAMLRKRPRDQRWNVGRRVADRPEAVRRLQPLHEPRDPIRQDRSRHLRRAHRDTSAPSASAACRWRRGIGRRGESEDGWRVEDHGNPVRHERTIRPGSQVRDSSSRSPNGIRHAVRQVHAGVAETDAGVRRGQQHLRARLVVCTDPQRRAPDTSPPSAAPGSTRCR